LRLGDGEGDLEKVGGGVRRLDPVMRAGGTHGHLPPFASSFSMSAAAIAPGTREPSVKMSVGVPVILCLRPNSVLRASTLVSQLPSGLTSGSLRTIQSCQLRPRSLAHHTALDFSTESGPRIGYRNM